MSETKQSSYDVLRNADPELFRRAVNVGNLVTCSREAIGLAPDVRLHLAAMVESAVIELVVDAMKGQQP